MGYTDGKWLGCDEGIKLGSSDCKVIGTILGNVDGNMLELDFGADLRSIYGYFDSYNAGKTRGELFGDSSGSTDGKAYGCGEGTLLGSTDGKVLDTILGNVDGITLGIDFGTDLGDLHRSFDYYNYGKL